MDFDFVSICFLFLLPIFYEIGSKFEHIKYTTTKYSICKFEIYKKVN